MTASKQVEIVAPVVDGPAQPGAMFTGYASASVGEGYLNFGVTLSEPADKLADLRMKFGIANTDYPPTHGYAPNEAAVPGEFTTQVEGITFGDEGVFVIPVPLTNVPRNNYFVQHLISTGESEKAFLFYVCGSEVRNNNIENLWFSYDDGQTWANLSEGNVSFEGLVGSVPDSESGIPVVVQQVNGKSIPAFLTDGEQGDPIGETNPLFVTVTNPGEEATTTEINVDGDAVSNASPFPVKVVSDHSVAASSEHIATVQGPSDTDLTDTIVAGASQIIFSAYCNDVKVGARTRFQVDGGVEINVPINGAPVVINAPDGLTLPEVTMVGHCEAANTEAVFFTATALRFD